MIAFMALYKNGREAPKWLPQAKWAALIILALVTAAIVGYALSTASGPGLDLFKSFK